MKNIYNIFRLNIKLFILSAASLIFPQSRSLQGGKATIKTLLMHVFMSKKYIKSKMQMSKWPRQTVALRRIRGGSWRAFILIVIAKRRARARGSIL